MFHRFIYMSTKSAIGSYKILRKFADSGFVKSVTMKHGAINMTEKCVAPYGSWKSPITSDLIVSDSIGLDEIAIDGEDIYWTEMRPMEAGRYVLVRRTPDGEIHDVISSPFNVRTRVHEYGGAAFAISEGAVYFSNFDDQRLYRQSPEASKRKER